MSTPTNTTQRIALDMDGTLADAIDVVFDHLGSDYTHEDVTSWGWPVEQFGATEFLQAFDHVWTYKWDDITPAEPRLYDTASELAADYTVDIVTAQPEHSGVTDGKRQWLDYHNIPYNEIVPVPRDETKADLEYDVYIDDKPHLVERVNEKRPNATVFVRNRPHNKNIDGDHIRVDTVGDVVTYLYGTVQTTEPNRKPQTVKH